MTDEARTPSRTARQALVRQLLESNEVTSQAELSELLAERGVHVTQGTVSKDLVEVGAVRSRSSAGTISYVLTSDEATPGQGVAASRLARLCVEMMIDAEASANLVVARTPPGAAQYFASAIDKAAWPELLGTIAGDDAVLLITRDPLGGEAVAERLRGLADGRSTQTTHETEQK
ncbi:arginine repressor [Aestuariimicrobium ganziense]|uniref:arginine repressor n=1 Tax=Aestuariimicrobium ganziense TaxID=2773677 RepID=UPI001943464C|nr:arginine repressor [Aestuariimicrobium ganziense]